MAPWGCTGVVSFVGVAASRLHSSGHPSAGGAHWLVTYMNALSRESVTAIGSVPVGIFPTVAETAYPVRRACSRSMTLIVAEFSSATKAYRSFAVMLTYTRPFAVVSIM